MIKIKKVNLLPYIFSMIFLISTIQSYSISAQNNVIEEQIRLEVNRQITEVSEGVIQGIEKTGDTVVKLSTIALSIVGIAVGVWAALGIINALSYKTIRQLEKEIAELKLDFKEELDRQKKYIEKIRFHEHKLAKFSVLSMPPFPKTLFKYILHGRLGKIITNEEIDKLLKDLLPTLTRLDRLKEKFDSGETRKIVVRNLSVYFEFLTVIDTVNGYVFDIKDEEVKKIYIDIMEELNNNIKTADNNVFTEGLGVNNLEEVSEHRT